MLVYTMCITTQEKVARRETEEQEKKGGSCSKENVIEKNRQVYIDTSSHNILPAPSYMLHHLRIRCERINNNFERGGRVRRTLFLVAGIMLMAGVKLKIRKR